MKLVALIIASFAALATVHAYSGAPRAGTLDRSLVQGPNAPIQLAQEDSNQNCGNGIGFTGNCNSIGVDISTGFDQSSVQNPNAAFPLAQYGDN